jgi:hypothetical protein
VSVGYPVVADAASASGAAGEADPDEDHNEADSGSFWARVPPWPAVLNGVVAGERAVRFGRRPGARNFNRGERAVGS